MLRMSSSTISAFLPCSARCAPCTASIAARSLSDSVAGLRCSNSTVWATRVCSVSTFAQREAAMRTTPAAFLRAGAEVQHDRELADAVAPLGGLGDVFRSEIGHRVVDDQAVGIGQRWRGSPPRCRRRRPPPRLSNDARNCSRSGERRQRDDQLAWPAVRNSDRDRRRRCRRRPSIGAACDRKPIAPACSARSRASSVETTQIGMWRVMPVGLQPVEDAPALHVGQEDVERDHRRMELARHRQRAAHPVADQPLEAGQAGRVEQHRREREVVLDDQHHAVAARDRVPIVLGHVREDLALEVAGGARRCFGVDRHAGQRPASHAGHRAAVGRPRGAAGHFGIEREAAQRACAARRGVALRQVQGEMCCRRRAS